MSNRQDPCAPPESCLTLEGRRTAASRNTTANGETAYTLTVIERLREELEDIRDSAVELTRQIEDISRTIDEALEEEEDRAA